ncbi:MAG: DUF523 domain-containing protein [Erysipelotrichales bacterium]|nr:DUF523 domain-containing protein [Erysipelotrichales bacterium]
MIEYAISACLCGSNVRYDGSNKVNETCKKLYDEGKAILICPEVMGGLLIPRNPSEIRDGKVYSSVGKDVTAEFHNGALLAINLIERYPTIHTIIVKESSPSCGLHEIYDGSFTGKKIQGNGVFINEIPSKYRVLTEHELTQITL